MPKADRAVTRHGAGASCWLKKPDWRDEDRLNITTAQHNPTIPDTIINQG
jgi:hypothetical protein